MSALLAVLAIFLAFPRFVNAAISLEISNFEKIDDYYSVDVILSGASADSTYYISTMFTKADQTNNLGFTWGQKGDWVKYASSPDKEFIKENFPIIENENTQKILIKPDIEDSGYKGPGEYNLSVRRYTGNSSNGPTGEPSNKLSVYLSDPTPTEESTPTPTEESTSTSTPTSNPTNTPTPTLTTTNTPTSTPTSTNTPTSNPTLTSSPSPKVLSAATESSLYKVFFQESTTSSSPSTQSSTPSSQAKTSLTLVGLGLLTLSVSVFLFRHQLLDKVK